MGNTSEFDARAKAGSLCAERGWDLGALLGQGGSAAVFAVGTKEGPAALKIFSPRFIQGEEGVVTRKRLEIVRQKLADNACPNLVRVYAIEEFESAPFMLMEKVPGVTLTEVLGLVPGELVEGIVRQVATAAKYLEEIGLTHRDIKSDNIVVSSDFKTATLIDVGVLREIDDPIGSGTDNDGQLPFVATARYSSPEYMFRLMDPGRELWRALNFYQLGGLLHDLLAGEPLFEDVVRQSQSNRYLVAYAVATKLPVVPTRSEVPEYLVSLAQRCLGKDPKVRLGSVSWSDFLERDSQREAEAFLGLRNSKPVVNAGTVIDVSGLARGIEAAIDERLMDRGISCRHGSQVASRTHVAVQIRWSPAVDFLATGTEISVNLEIEGLGDQISIATSTGSGTSRESISPPVLISAASGEDAINTQAYSLFIEASAQIASHLRKAQEQSQ